MPLGNEAAGYLRAKRKRLTDSSYRDYEGSLDNLARDFPDLKLADLEPPAGTTRIEEFLDAQWGDGAPRTYNKNLSILKDFFKFLQFKHFDHERKRLTIFTKGQKVRELPIPDQAFWMDLERLILDVEAQGSHCLVPRMKGNGASTRPDPTKPMGDHGMHSFPRPRFRPDTRLDPGGQHVESHGGGYGRSAGGWPAGTGRHRQPQRPSRSS
jgi:hypothetical protein